MFLEINKYCVIICILLSLPIHTQFYLINNAIAFLEIFFHGYYYCAYFNINSEKKKNHCADLM